MHPEFEQWLRYQTYKLNITRGWIVIDQLYDSLINFNWVEIICNGKRV